MIFQKWPRRQVTMTFTHDSAGDTIFAARVYEAYKEYASSEDASCGASGKTFTASNGVKITITWPPYGLRDWFDRVADCVRAPFAA